ncbi:rhodanese-like domain-containing protein [Marivita sp. GX14005]|uniref:rhodanese-like domain-containing protein n=1 Tax=Marivita sp. GX14005 TaxID=2942276 RepID=UPI0020188673|nr:rhodanese-like domain-containing protein [Marivita sp. GX14005]MCL3881339.1 rhodanese-like domain-containing protein [Marivita sp. GX14005]
MTAAVLATPLVAQSTAITETSGSFTFEQHGTELAITRSGLSCPPSCVQPLVAANGVQSLAELELIAFLQIEIGGGTGLLLDLRNPAAFSAGALPGAVNVPLATLAPSNPYRSDLFSALGIDGADFTNAFTLALYGAGPDDPAPVDAVARLVEAGYPAENLRYYRGGASGWAALGLDLAVPR